VRTGHTRRPPRPRDEWGFTNITTKSVDRDILNSYYIATKS
jgi:hypothetical protein